MAFPALREDKRSYHPIPPAQVGIRPRSRSTIPIKPRGLDKLGSASLVATLPAWTPPRQTKGNKTVNILLAHQSMLFREGLKRVLAELESGIAFVEADDWSSLVALSDDGSGIELALIEIGLPGPGPMNRVARLVERRPSLPVVVVAPTVAPEQVANALAEGARGFVPETVSAPVLIQALRLVMVGGVYVPPSAYRPGEGSERQEGVRPRHGPHDWHAQWGLSTALTERQVQVLELLSQGKSNKLIARELRIAEGTVKCHVASVLRMLNVANRTSAAMAASRWVGAVVARAGPQSPLAH